MVRLELERHLIGLQGALMRDAPQANRPARQHRAVRRGWPYMTMSGRNSTSPGKRIISVTTNSTATANGTSWRE